MMRISPNLDGFIVFLLSIERICNLCTDKSIAYSLRNSNVKEEPDIRYIPIGKNRERLLGNMNQSD